MYLIGDIGNTDIKICLYNSDLKLVKKIRFSTKLIDKKYLYKNLKFLKKYKNKIDKVLFSSVVPKVFMFIKLSLKKIIKKPCLELRNCKLNNLVKIKVNKKQIGSDRLANAVSVIVICCSRNAILAVSPSSSAFSNCASNFAFCAAIAPNKGFPVR